MSTRKGGQSRGPPKHQNRVTWVPDRGVKKKEKELGTKSTPYAVIGGVCHRCRDQIAWKRKYGKYKAISEPAKCAACGKRNIKDAYHSICKGCASEQGVCAKCRKSTAAVVNEARDAEIEKEEMQQLEEALSRMKERERRTVLRAMNKKGAQGVAGDLEKALKKAKRKEEGGGSDDNDDSDDDDDSEDEADSSGAGSGSDSEGEEEDGRGEEDGEGMDGVSGKEGVPTGVVPTC